MIFQREQNHHRVAERQLPIPKERIEKREGAGFVLSGAVEREKES